MSLTPSNMIELDTKAPDFTLADIVSGQTRSLHELASDKATVIMFTCNHCPYVKHIYDELLKLTEEYSQKGISFIGIYSNDIENYPEDSPEKVKALALKNHHAFTCLYDESQAVARAYQAACTPDFYIYDGNLRCVYRGQFDDSRPGNAIAVTGKDIRNALENILQDKPVSGEQKPSIGCNIKWKG